MSHQESDDVAGCHYCHIQGVYFGGGLHLQPGHTPGHSMALAMTAPTDDEDHNTELLPKVKTIAERFILWAKVKALDMVDEPEEAEGLARMAVHKEDGSCSESVRQAGAGAGRLTPH